MKVTDLRILFKHDERPTTRGHTAVPMENGLLTVSTDEGVEGHCFIGAWWSPAAPIVADILDAIKPELVGRDAFDREWLWRRIRTLADTQLRVDPASWAPRAGRTARLD